MAEMTGAQAMFEMMEREGVRYVFGNPGTTELPLMDLFAARDEIKYVLALHEDSALGMAAGYAEATGAPAVVNLHATPGLAHALGNLYNAHRAGTPLIVTAGQQDSRAMLDEPLLYADMLEIARQHAKWVWEVRHASEIPRVFARAFQLSRAAPSGPVFISLPVDVMEERAEMVFPPVTRPGGRVRGDREKIEEAARLLWSAERPAIIAGDGCARSKAVSEVVSLAEKLGARAHAEPLNALLTFPTSHPLFAGPLFPNAKQTLAQLEGADVILEVGVSNLAPLVYTGARMIPEEARVIQISADGRELGKNHPSEVAIVADPRAALEELSGALDELALNDAGGRERVAHRRELTVAAIASARAKFIEAASGGEGGEGALSPASVAREMRAAAGPGAVLVDESVTSTASVRVMFDLSEPGSYFYAKGGSLGLGLPMAVGVKLAMPGCRVLCAVGDGSALYSIQALWTAARYKLGVTFIIFNNASYMILKGGLLALNGSSVERGVFTGMDLTEPEVDFVALARSMGLEARGVRSAPELRSALDWALSQDGPTLLDVAINRDIRSVLR